MKKKKHCGKIGLMKFIFCIAILAQHTNSRFPGHHLTFIAGSAAVEFFFIVSGYLFAKKYVNYNKDEEIGDTTLNFLGSKIKHFLPYVIVLFLLSLPLYISAFKYTPNKYANILYTLLLIPTNGRPDAIFQLFWYISAMIIVQTMVLPFLLKYKKNFVKIVSPAIALILMTYILLKYGYFPGPWDPSILAYKGFIRSIAFINLGMFIYILHERFEHIEYTKFGKFLLALIENLGYLLILYIMNVKDAHAMYGLLMVILFSICILISFSDKLKINELFNRFFCKLEELSLPLYVNQFLILNILQQYAANHKITIHYSKAIILTFIISTILGIIEIEFLKLYDKHSPKIKKIFVK